MPTLWSSAKMPTRNVVITRQQAAMIEKLVRSGRYQNGSEVLRDGLRLVAQREAAEKAKLKALREAVRVGIDAIERGEYKEFESFEELDEYLERIGEEEIAAASER
jgi:antitoxin ParD1/3/4